MKLKVVDIDEAQEFLLTKDYLEQCHQLLPDDHRIFVYHEIRTTLQQKQWHMFLTLTFEHPLVERNAGKTSA